MCYLQDSQIDQFQHARNSTYYSVRTMGLNSRREDEHERLQRLFRTLMQPEEVAPCQGGLERCWGVVFVAICIHEAWPHFSWITYSPKCLVWKKSSFCLLNSRCSEKTCWFLFHQPWLTPFNSRFEWVMADISMCSLLNLADLPMFRSYPSRSPEVMTTNRHGLAPFQRHKGAGEKDGVRRAGANWFAFWVLICGNPVVLTECQWCHTDVTLRCHNNVDKKDSLKDDMVDSNNSLHAKNLKRSVFFPGKGKGPSSGAGTFDLDALKERLWRAIGSQDWRRVDTLMGCPEWLGRSNGWFFVDVFGFPQWHPMSLVIRYQHQDVLRIPIHKRFCLDSFYELREQNPVVWVVRPFEASLAPSLRSARFPPAAKSPREHMGHRTGQEGKRCHNFMLLGIPSSCSFRGRCFIYFFNFFLFFHMLL